MRRLAKIGLIILVAVVVLLCLYAAPPTRGAVESVLGPPIKHYGGGIISAVTSHPIWTEWILPFPNQLVLGFFALGIPFMWLWGKTKTRIRRSIFRGAVKEAGIGPTMTEPISSTTTVKEPTPTAATPKETPVEEVVVEEEAQQ